MPVVTPDGVQAEGNVSVVFVSGALTVSAPTVAQITAGTELSGFIKGGTFTPTAEQNTGDDRRLASRETYQVLGRVTRGFDDVQYVYNPQELDPAGHADNAAYEDLAEGTTGHIVIRWGLDTDTAYAAGQVVDIIPIEAGAQRKVGPAENDEFARLVVSQRWGVTGPSSVDVVVAA